jgi:hypothetical protein
LFKNGTEYHATDYRQIPMEDINLQCEIRLNKDSGVADYRRGRRGFRRVYSAKIDLRKSSVTVAMYQGEKAEEVHRGIPSTDMEAY